MDYVNQGLLRSCKSSFKNKTRLQANKHRPTDCDHSSYVMNRGLRLKDGNEGGGGWVFKKLNAFMRLSSQIKNCISVDLFTNE